MSEPQNRKWKLANRALLVQTFAFCVAAWLHHESVSSSLLAYCGGVSVTLGFYAGANVWQDKVTKGTK